MPEPTPQPAVGQIWQDNDPRGPRRQIRIIAIDESHAVVVVHASDGNAKPGRRTRIRLDRFRPISTGYRYVGSGD